jgi:hypothetical protein
LDLRHVAPPPRRRNVTVSIGAVKLVIPVDIASQEPARPRVRKDNGRFAHEPYDVSPAYEMGGYDYGA